MRDTFTAALSSSRLLSFSSVCCLSLEMGEEEERGGGGGGVRGKFEV